MMKGDVHSAIERWLAAFPLRFKDSVLMTSLGLCIVMGIYARRT